MAFGILGESGHPQPSLGLDLYSTLLYHVEDHDLKEVPGTGLLSDQGVVHGHEIAIDEAKDLKRGTGRYSHVVLIPQPSDDPRDP